MKIFVIILFVFLPCVAFGGYEMSCDYTAASCGRDDVQTAVTSAISAGGAKTVCIPAGNCTWGAEYQEVDVTGDVSLCGEGEGETIITRGKVGDSTFEFDSSNYVRITGIGFYGAAATTVSLFITMRNVDNFRIDNNTFSTDYRQYSPIEFKSLTKGLIDNNVFVNPNDGVGGSYYGITAGSPYISIPADVCNDDVCECWVGDKDAGDQASSVASGNTVISPTAAIINNVGGAGEGQVRRIYVEIASVGASPTISVASFSRSGDVFTARARTTGLSVAVGKNVFTVENGDFSQFAIHNGDYIGVYTSDCALDVASGSTGWSVAGDQTDQSSVDFGTADVGTVSVGAELFDDEGDYVACEALWDAWYDDTADDRGSFDGFNEDFDPNTDAAIYIEDNTFSWYKTVIAANWGNSHAFVIRHNTFTTVNGEVSLGQKPGTVFSVIHDNTFTHTGGGDSGYAIRTRVSGLIYNNTFTDFSTSIQSSGMRSYSDFYFPLQTRMDELYIYDNTYTSMACGSTDADCFGGFNSCSDCAIHGIGENGTMHFRAPIEGERLYNFTEYTYPHPLRGVPTIQGVNVQ